MSEDWHLDHSPLGRTVDAYRILQVVVVLFVGEGVPVFQGAVVFVGVLVFQGAVGLVLLHLLFSVLSKICSW